MNSKFEFFKFHYFGTIKKYVIGNTDFFAKNLTIRNFWKLMYSYFPRKRKLDYLQIILPKFTKILLIHHISACLFNARVAYIQSFWSVMQCPTLLVAFAWNNRTWSYKTVRFLSFHFEENQNREIQTMKLTFDARNHYFPQ